MRFSTLLTALTVSALLVAACSSDTDASVTGSKNKKRMTRQMLSMSSRTSASRSTSSASAGSAAATIRASSKTAQTGARTIQVTAEEWKFTPSVITVKKGENVTLQLQSKSGIHGFGVPGLGLNPTVLMGEKTTVKLPTDKAGTFEFYCSVPCGHGHKQMKGQIVIQE